MVSRAIVLTLYQTMEQQNRRMIFLLASGQDLASSVSAAPNDVQKVLPLSSTKYKFPLAIGCKV